MNGSYWRARLRFWWLCWRFDTPRRLRRAWHECVATWRDCRDSGDWPGHLFALAGVLLGRVTDGDRYREVRRG